MTLYITLALAMALIMVAYYPRLSRGTGSHSAEIKPTEDLFPEIDFNPVRKTSKRVYISGPMTGMPDFNYPYFNAEAERIRSLGYNVVNPVDINSSTDCRWQDYLRQDIIELLGCDAIVMLEGWEGSNGAHLEMHIAHRVGMDILFARDLVGSAA